MIASDQSRCEEIATGVVAAAGVGVLGVVAQEVIEPVAMNSSARKATSRTEHPRHGVASDGSLSSPLFFSITPSLPRS